MNGLIIFKKEIFMKKKPMKDGKGKKDKKC